MSRDWPTLETSTLADTLPALPAGLMFFVALLGIIVLGNGISGL